MKNLFKKAYTLAEVIIVMLIIAVVVSVTIKLTKAKLDNITSYTYYSAYNTVRAVASEMVKDFNPSLEDYGVEEPSIASKIKYFFASNFGVLPVWASCTGGCPTGTHCMGDVCLPDLNAPDLDKNDYTPVDSCEGALCAAPEKPDIPSVKDAEMAEEQLSCPLIIPCGQECNASTGFVLRDIAGFSRTCSDTGKQWSETQCKCIHTPQTISRNGEGFCKLFASYSNTTRFDDDRECNPAKSVADNPDEFDADSEADLVLRNGMILYNLTKDPEPIAELAGNSKGVTFTDSTGRLIDVDTWGYTLYIDIDGARSGDSKLWEDVYKFYVTLSGTVIPAYDTDNPETAGGDSKLHLQTSVYDEFVDNNGRHVEWVTKSKTFKESACTMGYVKATTPYCSGVAGNTQCSQKNHDCRLKTVMPIKFFGY